MSVLSLEGVSKNFGMKPLLEDVTLSLEADEKIGVIGANGSGKSTLLRIIAGIEPPDSGRLTVQKDAHIAFLSQNPVFEPGHSVLDAVFDQSNEVTRRLHDYEAVCLALEKSGGTDEGLQQRLATLAHQLDVSGGWDLEANAKAILSKLGITDTEALVENLSGGQRKRIALARALILQPDLLILDEPTNHLDADTIGWLEGYLSKYNKALLLVTHDRYFLDRVTNRMLEIERNHTHRFEGNYTYYLEMKEVRAAQRDVEAQKRSSLIKHELAWLRRGAKARTTKQKARIDRAHTLMAEPTEKESQALTLASPTQRLGKKVIDLKHVSKSYDDRTLISDFSYSFQRGDRIGIIGPNGTGKTTMLDLIASRIKPDEGDIEIGQTVAIGYYDQESTALKDELRVIDYIKEMAENIKTADGSIITASQMLERFLFPPAVQYTLVGSLSGGERRRLYLLRLLMGAPNVLLLDEPTNDFDIDTLIALESYLDAFDGCLITVSHDRYFLDRTVEHLIRFDETGAQRIYPGNYSAFLEIQTREQDVQVEAAKDKEKNIGLKNKDITLPATSKKSVPKKLSFNEKRELEQLERGIARAEQRKEEIAEDLVESATDFEKVNELYEELKQIDGQLETDFERWAELADRVQE